MHTEKSWRFRLRSWLWWKEEDYTDWVYDHSKHEWMYLGPFWEVVNKIECFLLGHHSIPDHCGIPEHDYCMFCRKSMPGAAHPSLKK